MWIVVALAAEILWVSGNLIDKYLIERYFRIDNNENSGVGTLILFSSFFAFIVAGFVLFYAGEYIVYGGTTPILGIILGLLNALWLLLYLFALERTELSRIIPILQFVPIFGLLFAFVILGEALTPLQIMFGGIIVLGGFILSYHTRGTKRGLDYVPLLFMSGAAVIIAFTDVFFKDIALNSHYWNTAFWMSIGIGLFGVILYVVVPAYRKPFNAFIAAREWKIFAANGVNEIIDNAANLMFAFATLLGPVALVQTANAYQPFLVLVGSVVLTRFIPNYFDEDIAGTTLLQKVAAIGLITIGSFFLYMSL